MPEDFKQREGSGNSLEGDNPIRRNKLLDLVPPEEMKRIQPHLDQKDFAFREGLYQNKQPNAATKQLHDLLRLQAEKCFTLHMAAERR